MTTKEKKAILLLSGGADSTTLLVTLLYVGRYEENTKWVIYPLSIDYGQKHLIEVLKAKRVVKECQYRYGKDRIKDLKVLKFDLSQIGHSTLTDKNLKVPDKMKDQIKTVVPFRNTLLATLAAAYGESLGLDPINIFMTPVKDDFESYRDCRREFFVSLSTSLGLGSTKGVAVLVHTPFVDKTKAEVLKVGMKFEVPYHLTHTCYNGLRPACGKCPACIERLQAFKECNLKDPLDYEE